MQVEFARDAEAEARNREATRQAYMQNLAAIQEEEFREQVASQKTRLERLKRYGDASAYNRELEQMDIRFSVQRAARGPENYWWRKVIFPKECYRSGTQSTTEHHNFGGWYSHHSATVTVVDNSNKSSTNITTPRTVRPDSLQASAEVAALQGNEKV